MNENKDLHEIIKQIKDVDNGINTMIIPMFKDTISDYKKTFNKLIILIVILLIGLFGVIGYSQYLIAKQAEKYNDFLSQFEFESSDVYQEVVSDEYGNAEILDGIEITNN